MQAFVSVENIVRVTKHLFYTYASFSAKMMNSSRVTKPKRLIAFDFDDSIVDANTDIVAKRLVNPSKIPQTVEQLHKSSGWITYMQEIFRILHMNGLRKSDILKATNSIPEVPGMIKCLKTLYDNNFDVIIISDSNYEFITNWNRTNGITKMIAKIHTNPAEFDNKEMLLVKPYHTQTHCSISTINLCKGKVLTDYLTEKFQMQISYENIFFVGDGYHDICPMLKLGIRDFACPRIGYTAEKRLEKTAEHQSVPIHAKVLRWSDGHNLLDQIKKNLNDLNIS